MGRLLWKSWFDKSLNTHGLGKPNYIFLGDSSTLLKPRKFLKTINFYWDIFVTYIQTHSRKSVTSPLKINILEKLYHQRIRNSLIVPIMVDFNSKSEFLRGNKTLFSIIDHEGLCIHSYISI